MGWYQVIKTINGRKYLYLQMTYREGGKVKTRNKYLGPASLEPLAAQARAYENAEDFIAAKLSQFTSHDAEEPFIEMFNNGMERSQRGSGAVWSDAFFARRILSSRALVSKEINDAARVDYWRQRILAGERPPVLVDIVDGRREIVDGNHKLAAYKSLHIANIPVIERMDKAALTDLFHAQRASGEKPLEK